MFRLACVNYYRSRNRKRKIVVVFVLASVNYNRPRNRKRKNVVVCVSMCKLSYS